MPPGQGDASAEATANGTVVRPASSLKSAQILEPSRDTKGSLLYRVEPEYPEEARQQSIQGPVVLEVGIGADGEVREVKAVSGPRLLADAALAAVKQWRFKPRKVNGKPTEMQARITLNFRLPSSPRM
jgi:protein TonB